ncbi:hypothetical protein WDY80_24090 (plasmid) [Gordonia hongkongensis]|uniref:hypothetical protein n=1 Tax=Gordonia hongkongensis TaxID=1701090 RepID=UPI0030CACE89
MPSLLLYVPLVLLMLIAVGLTLLGQRQSKVRDPQPTYRAAAGVGVLAVVYVAIVSMF